MNQRLTSQLSSFSDTLAKATTADDIQSALVALEATVLKSNLEEQSTAPVVVQDYLVGEANTRGLSWKLNLLRQVATANFTSLVRVGVHGGTVRLIGQQENIDTALAVYDALVPAYEELSKKAFTEFSDGHNKEEGEAAPHRVGWVNKYLIEAPTQAFSAVTGERENVAGSNRKAADLIAQRNSDIAEFKSTLTPAKAEKAPKAPKAPKEKKAPAETESGASPAEMDSENAEQPVTANAE